MLLTGLKMWRRHKNFRTISVWKKIHRKLEELAWRFCPVYNEFNRNYDCSLLQDEHATDIVFKKQEDLQQIYGELTATAIHTVKPVNVV